MQSTSVETATRASASGFKNAALLLRLAVAAAALAVIFYAIDFTAIAAAWENARPGWLGLAAGLWFANIGLQVWKWRLLLRAVEPDASWKSAAISLIGSFPLGMVTPGRWGEIGRAVYLPGSNWKAVFLLAVIDRLLPMAALLILGGASAVYFSEEIFAHVAVPLPAWIALTALVAATGLVLALPSIRQKIKQKVRHFVQKTGLTDGLDALRFRRALPGAAAVSILFAGVFCLQLALLVRAFAVIDLGQGLLGVFLAHAAKSLLPIAFGDLGVREGATVLSFHLLGVPAGAAVSASLLLFAMNAVLPALLGLPFLVAVRKEGRA